VFKDSRQRGDSRSYRSSVSNLSDEGFNDTITSYRVESDHYSGGRFGGGGWENDWGRPPVPRTGICFYEDRNFRGSYFCSSVGASSARVTEEANNRISSVQVFGSAEVRVYEDRDYRGDSTTFRSSIPDLQSSGWNNRISSFQVRAAGYGGGFGSGGWQGETSNSNSNIRMSRTQAEAVVRRAYRNILDREPDPGAEGWVKEVMDGKLNERQLEARLRQSPEYRNR
jgi:hypothetical protein